MSKQRTYANEKCESNHGGADERSMQQSCVLAPMAAKEDAPVKM